MRDGNDGAGEALQVLFEPLDAFGFEMVGRFVEYQQLAGADQDPGERDPLRLTA